jgi:hypothetical protein
MMATIRTDDGREAESAILEELSTLGEKQDSSQSKSPPQTTRSRTSTTRAAEEAERDSRYQSPHAHWDPEPGFAHIDGEIGGLGYNETKVDIVCVPCPGADPVETWARDPLPDGYFGLPNMQDNGQQVNGSSAVKDLAARSILSPAINRHLPKAAHLWIRQGIRKEINAARVLLYRHRELTEGVNLNMLSDDLLSEVWNAREGSVSIASSKNRVLETGISF